MIKFKMASNIDQYVYVDPWRVAAVWPSINKECAEVTSIMLIDGINVEVAEITDVIVKVVESAKINHTLMEEIVEEI